MNEFSGEWLHVGSTFVASDKAIRDVLTPTQIAQYRAELVSMLREAGVPDAQDIEEVYERDAFERSTHYHAFGSIPVTDAPPRLETE